MDTIFGCAGLIVNKLKPYKEFRIANSGRLNISAPGGAKEAIIHGEKDDLLRCYPTGANTHLKKPIFRDFPDIPGIFKFVPGRPLCA